MDGRVPIERKSASSENGTGADARELAQGRAAESLAARHPDLAGALERLFEPVASGASGPLRWTCRSVADLTERLRAEGRRASATTVRILLHELGYTLRGNQQTREGAGLFSRDAQFRHISHLARDFERQRQPAVWVDVGKRLIGSYRIGEWWTKGLSERAVRDFVARDAEGKDPLDLADTGPPGDWVGVGIDSETAVLAVEAIERWWRKMGEGVFPRARSLMVTTNDGGSQSEDSRVFRRELKRLAEDVGLVVFMCHFPPATTKWCRIEHRLSCRVEEDRRGRPWVRREAVVNLVGRAPASESSPATGRGGVHASMGGAGRRPGDVAGMSGALQGAWNYCVSPGASRGTRR